MKIKDILGLEIKKRIELLTKDTSRNKREENIERWLKEYDGEHKILQKPNKEVGNKTTGEVKTVETAKEVITFQKKIVNSAVRFMFGEPVQLVLEGDSEKYSSAFEEIKKVWKANKLQYFNQELMERVSVETAAAELWYVTGDRIETGKQDKDGKPIYTLANKKIKVRLLSKTDGYLIYPHFDDTGDMDALTIKYEIEELVEDKPKMICHVDVYTAEKIFRYIKNGTDWTESIEPNIFGKITAVYYEQNDPEWKDVQHLIDRLEQKMSSHADTNDYFDSPVLKIKGKVATLPEKTEDGKILMFEGVPSGNGFEYGDADYVTWDQSPESMKLEYEMLKYYILFLTDTPDIGFDNMKGIGSVLSGTAIKLMFMAALSKAKDKRKIYGAGLERRINVLKAMLSKVKLNAELPLDEMNIEIVFGNPLPENIDELITTLTTATGGSSILSQETAVRNNPLVKDPNEEIARLEEEAQKAQAVVGASFEI